MQATTDKLQMCKFDEQTETWFDEQGNPVLRYIAFTSENLRETRKTLRITQDQLAAGLDVSRPLVTQYETEILKNPDAVFLAKLGQFFSEQAGYKIVFYIDHPYQE